MRTKSKASHFGAAPRLGGAPRFGGAPRLALATLAAAVAFGAVAETITVVSWGGAYGRASRAAVLEPFSAETGIQVQVEEYNGGLAQVRAQVEIGDVFWDVVDFEMPDMVRGCDEGLLETVDLDALPAAPDGKSIAEDYYPGTTTDCGPSTIYYATVVAYNAEAFPEDARPATVADFFDLAKFPGRRGMNRTPHVNLEFALMADGVPRDEVYAVLDTPEGMARAFAKLDTIKDSVRWWEAGAQPPQMLADQEVTMSTAFNGRIFNAQVVEKQPFVVIWDGQVLDSAGFGIVRGTKHLAAAQRLVNYAAQPAVMARVSEYISYSPARRSGAPLVAKHKATGIDMAPHMPTDPANMTNALPNDWAWWSDNADEVRERFGAWLAQ